MKPQPVIPTRPGTSIWLTLGLCALVTSFASFTASAATATVYSENFDSYSGAATSLEDTADADITHPNVVFTDDNPHVGPAGSGIQLVNWQTHSGPNALLVRSGTEVQVNLVGAKSGTKYQFDFWLYVVKEAATRNFYLILRGQGADSNGDDYIAYRSDRAATPAIFLYDGIGPTAWVNTGAAHTESAWQHHRLVVDTAAQTSTLYLDDMTTAVTTVDLARPDAAVPSLLRILHEGTATDAGYFIIDDISLTVEDSVDLATTFREGFENYPARTSADDDADPKGPWITVESEGTGGGKELAPYKVQVVDSTVVPARSGTKSLKLEGGQRAGSSIAWGVPPLSDVQITWWARVPASVDGTQANYLRFSLYGAENGNALAGDNALLGYGSRDGTIGDETSLTYYVGSGWVDSMVDYTPDTWEEYRLTTHTAQGSYTIMKNPSSANPTVVVDRMPFIGSASTWTPVFLAAWSSSNGSGHPPVYIDDIEIKSLVADALPFGEPYTVQFDTSRFSKVTTLTLTNVPVGSVAVDPRDKTTILFATDVAGGGIYRATKVSSGNWTVDPTPIVRDLDRPSGLAIEANGTIWWTHDYGGQIGRLPTPWAGSQPETVISSFSAAATDDDPIDLVVAPPSFNGTLGKPGMIVVADRGVDGDNDNALHLIDPATTELNQAGYVNFLVGPTPTDLSANNLNAIAALPQTGEVVALSQDGFITAVDGDGVFRYIPTSTLWVSTPGSPAAASIAVDPTTGRIWVADDALDQIWSIPHDGSTTAPDRKELTLKPNDETRPDRQADFHDPGLAFAPDGSFLVVTDTSTVNGGGRILIFHNETVAPPTFAFTGITSTASGVQLTWQAAGDARYRVQRTTSLLNSTGFQDISEVLTTTQFTDTNPPVGTAFYRVVIDQK